ncbi:acyl-CoA dehydrogenase family member 11-like isoform X1 [Ptychodera flava]|uniref:acyl-CoA dehydrogenase family member 11-like isoform X1 n=1 Tax=Ptychodera flava TaxID=63121 RepID=UPI00396A25B1
MSGSQTSPVLDTKVMSPKGKEVLEKVKKFMVEHVYPAEQVYTEQLANSGKKWWIPPIIEEVKAKAKEQGLWNLFLPGISGLTVLEYALIAEETGKSRLGPEAFNCAAPDTGNMEVLYLYGSPEQKKQWLEPLLEGKIRSCFSMTEPQVASSDATNMQCTITRDGDSYVINGRKWWSSGAGDPRCKVSILMGKTGGQDSPRHKRHSMILVPLDTPGVKIVRFMQVFGNEDAPHGHAEIEFNNVRVPLSNMILGEGRGFEIAQGRLGPGRIHHCMRCIGLAEQALKMMCARVHQRSPFGKTLAHQGVVRHQIAESRIEIEAMRLMVLKAAHTIDKYGTKAARKEVAMIKVLVPRTTVKIIDRAIQIHGGAGVSQDFPLHAMYAGARTLQIADGPDEVHLSSVALQEMRDQLNAKL